MACLGAVQQVSIVTQKESLKGASHNSQRENTYMDSRLRSLYEGAVMHRNSYLIQRLILALMSEA